MRHAFLLIALFCAQPLFAQTRGAPTQAPATLTLEEAISLGRRYNPGFLQIQNDRRSADAALRAARGALLPSVNASLSSEYQQGGNRVFSGVNLGGNGDVLQSFYNIGIGYRLNSASFVTPALQKASRAGVEADIAGVESLLKARIAELYLNVLQSEARANLQDTLVAAANAQVVLAKAREIVGSGTQLDVSRAEVALGQAQVAQIQERNQVEIAKLRLFQEMGLDPRTDVRLTSTFPIVPLSLELAQLLEMARRQNPVLLSTRQRQRVAELGVRRQRGEYSPTLTLSTGWSGYTYEYSDPNFLINQAKSQVTSQQASCVEREQRFAAAGLPNQLGSCGSIVFTDEQAAALRRENNQFPFGFNRSPRSVSATLSLPLFDGFAREQRLQEALVARDDARHSVRLRELTLTADVTAAYLTLQTALRTVALQERNELKARDEMKLSQDRYRIGMATFVDLTEARSAFERAASDRINAIYDYHKAFAALESAVGRPLR